MQFVVVAGIERGRTYQISDGKQIVGTAFTNDIPINDPQVLPRQVQVENLPFGLLAIDLSGYNGLNINGNVLPSPQMLLTGDTLQIGTTLLHLVENSPPEPIHAAPATATSSKSTYQDLPPNEFAYTTVAPSGEQIGFNFEAYQTYNPSKLKSGVHGSKTGDKSWTVFLKDGKQYNISVEPENSKTLIIYVNGERLVRKAQITGVAVVPIINLGPADYVFSIEQHDCFVRTASGSRWDLVIDGESIATGKPVKYLHPVPGWILFFLIIDLISLRIIVSQINSNFIGSAIIYGYFGASAAMSVLLSRIAKPTFALRLLGIIVLTAGSWILFFMLLSQHLITMRH